jgi:hypothetical protein
MLISYLVILVGGLEHLLFSMIYGMSSFPLPFIFFRLDYPYIYRTSITVLSIEFSMNSFTIDDGLTINMRVTEQFIMEGYGRKPEAFGSFIM